MEVSQVIAVITVIFVLGISMLIVFNRSRKEQSPLSQVRGRIERPGSGEAVPRTIHCSGSIQQDVHNLEVVFWLAVETDGLIWPKEPSLQPDEAGRWSMDIREEGYPDTFSISLWAASPRGTKHIQEWLDAGRRTNDYPGLSALPGVRRTAQVSGLRLA